LCANNLIVEHLGRSVTQFQNMQKS